MVFLSFSNFSIYLNLRTSNVRTENRFISIWNLRYVKKLLANNLQLNGQFYSQKLTRKNFGILAATGSVE